MVVGEPSRRQGYGRQLVEKLHSLPGLNQYPLLTKWVPDTNTGAHLWLRSLGFTAIRMIPGEGEERDSYLFCRPLRPVEVGDG